MSQQSDYKKDLFEFYKTVYESELERKEALLERTGVAGGFLTILGGVLAYYINALEFPSFRSIHLLFYIPFTAGLITTIISMVFVALSIGKRFRYGYIVSPEDIARHIQRIESEDAGLPPEERENIAESLRDNLSAQYCRCGTVNRTNNTKRSGYVYESLRWAIISMFIVLAALPGFFVLKSDFPDKPTNVNIVSPLELKNMSEEQPKSDKPASVPPTPTQPQGSNQPAQQASPPPAVKPVSQRAWPKEQYIIEANEKKIEGTNLLNESEGDSGKSN